MKSFPYKTKNYYKKFLIVLIEIIVALFFGLAIAPLGLGSMVWLFGGMGAGVIVVRSYQAFTHEKMKPNQTNRKIGQAMVGLAIGFAIADNNLIAASSRLPLFIFLTIFMFVCGSAIGYFYARISKTNLLNAMLATVPGGVATMSSIAAEYNRNVSLVAMVQTLRITSVILIIPLIAGASSKTSNIATFSLQNYALDTDLLNLLLLFLVTLAAWLGVMIAQKLHIPAASFFGTLIIGLVFNYVLVSFPVVGNTKFQLPEIISLIGQILLGITVGEAWNKRIDINKKNFTYALISVAMTILSGFVAATIAMIITSWDWLTCMLVTAPGGSTEMILVALALDHNPEIVTFAHSVRLMALNLSLPLWLFLFRYWDKKTITD